MTQNIYDDEAFFAAYSQLPRSLHGLESAPEWPTLRELLPDLRQTRVLDLGCGFGWFCRWAREQGALSVLGVDVSERMLARAESDTEDAAITYLKVDLEHYRPPQAAFELVYSSLALHYIVDLEGLVRAVHAALVAGGRFVFSIEHPVFTAPSHPGFIEHAAGHTTWPLDGYLDEGPRATNWLADGVIKQHRMLATYVNVLVRCGFLVSELIEWAPSPEQIAMHSEWVDERKRPPFLLVSARRT